MIKGNVPNVRQTPLTSKTRVNIGQTKQTEAYEDKQGTKLDCYYNVSKNRFAASV